LSCRYYDVDEAGDPVLFNRRGHVIVGEPGCSRFFILGKLEVAEPESLASQLTALRHRLLADEYFRGVPSMAPESGKTARLFHAKDDLPEVRREVFRLLRSHDVRFFAVLRDKQAVAEQVLSRNRTSPTYRYGRNDLYDGAVPRLFENRLHKDDAYRIVFARRGSRDRTAAFERGLVEARNRFRSKWSIESTAPIEVVASAPSQTVCLQAVDYFLWATQRCFERGERRYLDLLWEKVGLIVDWDDHRSRPCGEYYSQKQPIPEGFRR